MRVQGDEEGGIRFCALIRVPRCGAPANLVRATLESQSGHEIYSESSSFASTFYCCAVVLNVLDNHARSSRPQTLRAEIWER